MVLFIIILHIENSYILSLAFFMSTALDKESVTIGYIVMNNSNETSEIWLTNKYKEMLEIRKY